MAAEKIDFDALEIWRCPQLGGPVTFFYCRVMNEGRPCPRTLLCWSGTVDVMPHLEEHCPPEELQRIFGQPSKDRLTRIIDTVRETRDGKQ